jgi:phosphoribosylaminoimidazolecarboxamide formyltransferase/IMP cyclohydrolase
MSAQVASPGGGGPPSERALRVSRALLSVANKTGIVEFARGLERLGVELISTGGTAAELEEAGVDVRRVEELTGAAEILGGRVKTLHPRLHAALLAVRDDPDHMAVLEEQGIEPIDLVCVNLYPFERAVSRREVDEAEALETIDIGGPTMIRAAAKNHGYVAVVVTPESYDALLGELEEAGGEVSAGTRHWLANEAFAHTARYDAAISRWFGARYEVFPSHLVVAFERFLDLPYGENPHQRAAYYTEVGARSHVLSRVAKRHGPALSFNNLLDLDAARRFLGELEEPGCVIVKHNNPSGAAVAKTIEEAFEKALACDPISAFGGLVALNRPVEPGLAERLHENFIEVLVAPGYGEGAGEILEAKESIRILEDTEQRLPSVELELKRVRGGLLVEEADRGTDEGEALDVVTEAQPTDAQWRDLALAWRAARHVRSNAIVLAKDEATVGIGAGQMSRVDSVRIALEKAREARGESAAEYLEGASMASDAFFPFADGPAAAIEAGIGAIIQPGGSKRDAEVIAACEEAGIAMVLTGRRHFRH